MLFLTFFFLVYYIFSSFSSVLSDEKFMCWNTEMTVVNRIISNKKLTGVKLYLQPAAILSNKKLTGVKLYFQPAAIITDNMKESFKNNIRSVSILRGVFCVENLSKLRGSLCLFFFIVLIILLVITDSDTVFSNFFDITACRAEECAEECAGECGMRLSEIVSIIDAPYTPCKDVSNSNVPSIVMEAKEYLISLAYEVVKDKYAGQYSIDVVHQPCGIQLYMNAIERAIFIPYSELEHSCEMLARQFVRLYIYKFEFPIELGDILLDVLRNDQEFRRMAFKHLFRKVISDCI